MPIKPGDKLIWRSQSVTFVSMVAPPTNGGGAPPALSDVDVPAAWVRQKDNTVIPVPLHQLTYEG